VRARALEASGRLTEAAEARQRALEIDPGLASARLGEARRLLREKKRDKGLAALRQLVADDPEDAAARGALLDAEAGRAR
jgi:tetratricopeptide (TPR) repeat protein